MSSRYNPIRETFTTGDIISISPLNKASTPPGTFMPPSDLVFTGVGVDTNVQTFAYPTIGNLQVKADFNVRDIPHIVGLGIFGNLLDCCTEISDHACDGTNPINGLSAIFTLNVYDKTTGLPVQVLVTTVLRIPFRAFNAIFDYDIFYLENVKAILPQYLSDAYVLRLEVVANVQTFKLSTILMDPAFAAKRFTVWPELVVEHSFPMQLSLGICAP